VPYSIAGLADIPRPAVDAVEDFQRRGCTSVSPTVEEPISIDYFAPLFPDSAGSLGTSDPSTHGELDDIDMFRLLLFPEIDLGSYYMSLMEALLMDPPS
jgi:hypothetical protein